MALTAGSQGASESAGLEYIYAALRIAFGAIGVMFVIGMADFDTFWDPTGLVRGGDTGWRRELMASWAGPLIGRTIFWANAVCSLLMLVGYGSRLGVPAMFMASAIQGWWNPLPLSGAFEVRSALLFPLMWADCGRRWSVDAWLAREVPAEADAVSRWPLMALRIQVGLVYLSTGLYKLGGAQWRDGTALHYVLNNNAFARFPSPPPPELTVILILGTYLTLFWELAFALLIAWRPTRLIALGLGIVMHLGTAVTMELGPFPWVSLASYLAFLDPRRFQSLLARIGSKIRQAAITGN